jgi:hypothetical protein
VSEHNPVLHSQLYNVLHESGSMEKDVKVKRATIRESTELRETFGFASPAEVLRAPVSSEHLCQAGMAVTETDTHLLC